MVGKYDVYWQSKIVGQANVIKTGMFYEICCHCVAPDNNAYYLWVLWDGHPEKIGICAYGNNGYGLTTKISVKKAGEGHCRFELRPREPVEKITYIDELRDPFPYIKKLPDLRIKLKNGRMGILIIKNSAEG